jgi:ferredoxin
MVIIVEQARDECIGCGACAATSPDFWEMNSDGKADLKGAKKVGEIMVLEIEEAGSNKEAADVCPVQIIKVKE